MARKNKKNENFKDFDSQLYNELERLQKKFSISDKELIEIISRRGFSKENIPICIFKDSKLSSFEAIVKYLKENCELNFKEIGDLLNRSQFTISSSYRSAKKKQKKSFIITSSKFDIPTKKIANRKLSVLESIVSHLKSFNLKFSEIAEILNLNQKTVWTVFNRAKNKHEA